MSGCNCFKKSPYCRVVVEESQKTTIVHKKGNFNPSWASEVLMFSFKSDRPTVHFKVFNKSTFGNDKLLCECSLEVTEKSV